MKITKRQLRKIIREEMAHPQSGLGKSIADVDFPSVVSYEDRSEIAYNQDDLDGILNDIGPRGIKYSLDSLEDMEPSPRPIGGSIEQFGESIKITKRQLRKIIKEAMDDDFYEFRHQEDQKDLKDLRADVVFEIIEAYEGLSGDDIVEAALQNSVFGGAQAKDVYETLDYLLDSEDIRFNVSEDEWHTKYHGML